MILILLLLLVQGREVEEPLYRMEVPEGWDVEVTAKERLGDTREALVTVVSPDGAVRGVVHNFPDQIPPEAQVERWLKQQERVTPTETEVTSETFSGYRGLRLETEEIIAWGLVLGQEYQQMVLPKEWDAAVTLKFTGETGKWREEILGMGRSFELIQELPEPW